MNNCKQTNIPKVDNSDNNCCFTATDECITTTNALPTIGTSAGETLESVLSELDTYIADIQAGVVSWGSITGDINDQTDLINLFDTKANNDEVVKSVNFILPDAIGNVDIPTPTGLEAIDEGNGVGWRLIGKDPDNYGNIGLGAVDLSTSTFTGNNGATGNFTITSGENNIASGIDGGAFGDTNTSSSWAAFAIGYNNVASDSQAMAFGRGNVASGWCSTTLNEDNIASGRSSTAIGKSNEASGHMSFVSGSLNVSEGDFSSAHGQANTAASYAEFSIGHAGTEYTPLATDYWDYTLKDRLFNIGNGINFINRRDAFTILKTGETGIGIDNFEANTTGEKLQVNGLIKSDVTTAEIGAGSPKTVITKEYADATYAGGSGGGVSSIVEGSGVTVDNTDPSNPIISSPISTLDEVTAAGNISNVDVVAATGRAFVSSKFELRIGGVGGTSLDNWQMKSFINSDLTFSPPSSTGFGDAVYDFSNLSIDRRYGLPDKSGTIALLDDITQNLQQVLDTGNTFESVGTLNGIQGVSSGSGSGIYIETNADGESITSNATATATGYHFVGNREGIPNFSVDVDGNIESSGTIEADGGITTLAGLNAGTANLTGGLFSDSVNTNLVDTSTLEAGTGVFTGVVKGVTPIAPEDLATKQYVDDNSGGGGTNPDWANITNTPTTLAGYGITDSYTSIESQDRFLRKDINTTKIADLAFGSGTVPMGNVSYHTGDTAFSQQTYDAGFLTHRRSGGGVFSGWKWSNYATDILVLNTNGVLEVNNVVKASDPVAPEDLTTKSYVDSAIGSVTTVTPKVAFIFDDGFISHRDVVKPIFDARGIKGGIAMSNRLIEAFQRLRADELQDFQKDGWEILGHSVNHETMNSASVGIGYKRVEAEVKLNKDQLESYGYNIDGWVTPSSIMDDSFIPALHNRFNYGFTKSNGANPIQDYSDRYKLTRFSLEQNTLIQAQDAADAAIDNNQDIIFYTHDVPAGSQKETDLIALIDYCIAQGYEITTPREALKQRYDFQNYELDDVTIIENNVNSFSLLNATQTTTDGVMTVTPDTATSTVLVQSTVALPSYVDENTQLSFSVDMKLVTGITPVCSIGIQFKNSGGTIIRSDEEGVFEMSTFNLRYYVTNNVPKGTTQITYFVRAITDNDATTTFEVKEPLLSTGDNIINITQIPVQAADADTLDGLDSTQFLRSDVDTTKTAGHLNFSTATQLRFGDSFDALIQQTVTDFRLRLNNFDEFRITDGALGARLRLYRSTGNMWIGGEMEATSLKLNGGTTFNGIFDASGLLVNQTWTLPNQSGTMALTSDLTNYYDITTSNDRFMKIASNEVISGLKTFTHPSGAIFRHTSPNIRFEDTDGGLNEKNTMIAATGNAWELRFYRDDYSINTAAIRIERVGEQSTNMLFNTPRMDVAGDIFAAGNLNAVDMTLTGDVDGRDFLLNTVSVKSMNPEPTTSADTGTLGEIRVTANYIYVCTATNTWKRTPLTTW